MKCLYCSNLLQSSNIINAFICQNHNTSIYFNFQNNNIRGLSFYIWDKPFHIKVNSTFDPFSSKIDIEIIKNINRPYNKKFIINELISPEDVIKSLNKYKII